MESSNLEKQQKIRELRLIGYTLYQTFIGTVNEYYSHTQEKVVDLLPDLAQVFITNALTAYGNEVEGSQQIFMQLSEVQTEIETIILDQSQIEELDFEHIEDLLQTLTPLKHELEYSGTTPPSFGQFVFDTSGQTWLESIKETEIEA